MVSGLYTTILHYYNNVHMYNGHIESQANIPELDLASSPTNIITDQFAQVFTVRTQMANVEPEVLFIQQLQAATEPAAK